MRMSTVGARSSSTGTLHGTEEAQQQATSLTNKEVHDIPLSLRERGEIEVQPEQGGRCIVHGE